jgi:small subunit ribosomal protein S13
MSKNMARIAGIDLPKNKRGEIGLTYIFGIGRSTAQYILIKLVLISIRK